MGPLFEYLIDRDPYNWAYGTSIEMFFASSSSTGLLALEIVIFIGFKGAYFYFTL